MEKQTQISVNSESALCAEIANYVQSLHNVSETSREHYKALLKKFAEYLLSKGISRFNDATRIDIGQFLSTKNTANTRNLYIFLIKSFYKNYLGNEKLVEHLHQKPEEEIITPSELLTPEEVISLANEAGKKKDMYKVITLVLFESCARINELLEARALIKQLTEQYRNAYRRYQILSKNCIL